MGEVCDIREMNFMNAFDTNILVYSLDSDEPLKQAQARALLASVPTASPPFILLWQVAGELLNWLRKWETAGKIDGADGDAHFHDLLAMFPLVVPTKQSFTFYFQRTPLISARPRRCRDSETNR